VEATNEANTIVDATDKAKKTEAWQQLTFDEIAAIEAAQKEVKASLKGGDYKIIRQSIELLDKKTRRLAEVMMDTAVTGALGGKTMAAAGEALEASQQGNAPTAPHAFAPAQVEETATETKPAPEDAIEAAEADPETPGESTED
jgi:molecular chaperone DnaK/molecular chaperone HscA